MKHLIKYLDIIDLNNPIITLSNPARYIYYIGKGKDIPELYKKYYVIEHSRLLNNRRVTFTIIEDAENNYGILKENSRNKR